MLQWLELVPWENESKVGQVQFKVDVDRIESATVGLS